MMGISIAMIIVMIVRDNRYNEIEEINENNLEINNDNNDPLISDDYPVSVLDKNNSEKKLIYKKKFEVSPSTGPITLNGPKIRNLYGNEYIELNTNENEEIEKNSSGRLLSESDGRKKSFEI